MISLELLGKFGCYVYGPRSGDLAQSSFYLALTDPQQLGDHVFMKKRWRWLAGEGKKVNQQKAATTCFL